MKLLERFFLAGVLRGVWNWVPTIPYLKIYYKICIGKKLNLKNPETYNEKLQWIKVYDHNPQYIAMVDKYEAKRIVADQIGNEHIIPTLGVWNNAEDIDFDLLPDKFVLKTTHDSGGIIIIDKNKNFDKNETISFFKKRLKRNLYLRTREWPYKYVKPRIIAEQYMVDEKTQELRDYKIFTFNGQPKVMFIAAGRQKKETSMTYYDIRDGRFSRLDISWGYPASNFEHERPSTLKEMIDAATILSQGTNELRVDFYEINGRMYFGELTFFDGSGFTKFEPEEWDKQFGSWIDLKKYSSD